MNRDEGGRRPALRTLAPTGREARGDDWSAGAEEGDELAAGPPLADDAPPVVPSGPGAPAASRAGIYEGDAVTSTALTVVGGKSDPEGTSGEARHQEDASSWRLYGSARDLGAAAVRGGILEVVAVEDVARRLAGVLAPFEQLLMRATQIDADHERMSRDLRAVAAEVRSAGMGLLAGLAKAHGETGREQADVLKLLGEVRETARAANGEADALRLTLRDRAAEVGALGEAATAVRATIEGELSAMARRILRWYLVVLVATLCVTTVFVFALLWVLTRG